MKLKHDEWKAMKFLGTSYANNVLPMSPRLRIAFGFADGRLDEKDPNHLPLPAVEIQWSGFEIIDVNQESCDALKEMTGSPWAVCGAVGLVLNRELFTGEEESVPFTGKSVEQSQNTIKLQQFTMAALRHVGDVPNHNIVSLHEGSESLYPESLVVRMVISTSCTEDEWNRRYQLRAAELAGATKYFEQVKGVKGGFDKEDLAYRPNLN